MRMAVLISNRSFEWAQGIAREVERRLGIELEAAPRIGTTFIVPKADSGSPREALDLIRVVRGALPDSVGDGYLRPLYIWRGESEPVSLEEAYVAGLETNLVPEGTPIDALSPISWTGGELSSDRD